MAKLGEKRGSDDSSDEDEPIATPVTASATATDPAAPADSAATVTPASSDDLSVSQLLLYPFHNTIKGLMLGVPFE